MYKRDHTRVDQHIRQGAVIGHVLCFCHPIKPYQIGALYQYAQSQI